MPAFATQRLYIGGAYVDATGGETFDTLDPATGETLATVQQASAADIERAVQAARGGQREWAALTAMQRSRILRRAVELLRERNDELAALETRDTGKPIAETPRGRYRHRCGRDRVLRGPRHGDRRPADSVATRCRSSTRGANRLACARASAHGITRSRSRAGSRRPRSRPAMR